MLTELTDSELLERYRSDRDQQAMRVLVERHYDTLYRRFMRELGNAADAEDASQKLWLQVARHVDDYDDQGKFTHYLSTIASNLIKAHWRDTGTARRVITDTTDDDDVPEQADPVDPELQNSDAELVRYLTEELIPGLPPEQRLAWLLRHESEYWEPGRPLRWQHMAELNGMDTQAVWQKFEVAREKFMRHGRPEAMPDIDTDEASIFLVWTQAQRADKGQSFSWDYFSALLNVPVNTMKTRYRAAQQSLASALADYRSA